MTRSSAQPPFAALAALVIGNIALAFGPWFVRMAETGPVASAFWRIALGAPVLIALALGSGWRPKGIDRLTGAMVVVAGLCFAADLGSWHLGIVRTTLANATLFGNSATLFFPVYGFIVARALPSRMQAAALAIAGVGAALLLGRSFELSMRHLAGDALCMLAGLLYTFYFIFMARARSVLPPLPALALSTLASVAPLLLFALALGERLVPDHWGPLIALALASQVLGQSLMIYALGRLSPMLVGIALLIQPVVGATVGWVAYGEQLGAADLAGAALVALALVLLRRER